MIYVEWAADGILVISCLGAIAFLLAFRSRLDRISLHFLISRLSLFLLLLALGSIVALYADLAGTTSLGESIRLLFALLAGAHLLIARQGIPESATASWKGSGPEAPGRDRTAAGARGDEGVDWLHDRLKDDRELLQTILNKTSTVIFVKGVDGRYLLANEQFKKLFGIGHGEVRGKMDYEIFPREMADAFRKNDQAVFNTRQAIELEEIAPHEDGPHTYVSTKFPIFDREGQVYAVGGVATDITPLKRIENELRKANTFLDSVIEHIPDMIFIKEAKELRFVRFNRAGEQLLGLESTELLGKNDYDLFPKEQADFFTRKDREVLSTKGYADVEVEPIDTKVRGRRYLHTKKIALNDECGEPEFLLGISQDITEQRHAQERLASAHLELEGRVAERTEELNLLNEQMGRRLIELEEAEEKFRLAVESSPSAMVMVNAQGKIVLVNAETERVFGYSRSELLGQPVEMLVPDRLPNGHPLGREEFIHSERRTPGSSREISGRRRDGAEIPIEIGLNPLVTSHGRFTLSAIVDVSNRKAADEFMRKALREKDLLLKEIHHRVKNNMQVISSLLKLQSAYLPDEEVRQLFRQSDDRIRSMALIHERLYRSEGLVDIDLSEYVKELAENLFHSYVVDASRIRLCLEVGKVFLGIDQAIPCGLILNEIVSNSLKHAFPSGRSGAVLIRLSEAGEGDITLQVTDDGSGLPADFDILHPTSLGMEIVRTLAEQVDGTLKIDREKGTAFTLQFKRVDRPQKPITAQAS